MYKLLIIEDEESLCNAILSYLLKENYSCEIALNFAEAENKIQEKEFDILILDLNLPDGDGLDLLQRVKEQQSQVGVIIITARDALNDRTRGLDLGADDYLTKPFHLPELNSRIKSLARRMKFDGSNQLHFDLLQIDLESQKVSVANKTLELTKTEYEILLYFMTNKERVITKDSLVEYIWGDNRDVFDSLEFVYTHIRNLRKKVVQAGGKDYIQTVYGVGYRFQSP